MGAAGAEIADAGAGGRFSDPRISLYLNIATYIVGGIGIGFGLYKAGEPVEALHCAVPLMVGVPGILSFVRHSLFHSSDQARMRGTVETPFYIIELGMANGAIGVVALLAFFLGWGTGSEVAVTLSFAAYLLCALCFVIYNRVKERRFAPGPLAGLALWGAWVGFMFYFAIAAAVSAGL